MPRSRETAQRLERRLELLEEIGRKNQAISGPKSSSVPTWRRIEMMRERRALVDALDDPLLGFVEPEENVFPADSELASRYYTPGPAATGPDADDYDADAEDDDGSDAGDPD